jgi:dCMP deaminase
MDNRPSWQKYFMDMAFLVSQRSTCLRRKVGAVLVKNNQIIATGYNGTPKNIRHCDEVGCMREALSVPSGEKHELCRGVHAEQNAIIQSAINGAQSQDAVLYCTNHPCSICAKMIINAEIKTVYIADPYPDKLAGDMLAEAGIDLIYVDPANGKLSKLT